MDLTDTVTRPDGYLEERERIHDQITAELKQIEERLYRLSLLMDAENAAGNSNLIDQYAFDSGMLCGARTILDGFLDREWLDTRDTARAMERLNKALGFDKVKADGRR